MQMTLALKKMNMKTSLIWQVIIFHTFFKLEMTSFMFRTFQEAEDPGGQVVKKDNDREHKVFKVKSLQN